MRLGQLNIIRVACCIALLNTAIPPVQSTQTHFPKQNTQTPEAELYKNWYLVQAQRNYALASEFARTYIEQYPEGKYAQYLRKWIDAYKPPPPDVEWEMSRLRCQYIRGELSNSYINPGLWSHDIVIKMDEEAFSESNVREVVEVLSRKYKEPRGLVIYVITVHEQMPGGPSHARPPEEYYKHHRAVYNRTKNEEYFEYTEGPTDVVMKRVGLN